MDRAPRMSLHGHVRDMADLADDVGCWGEAVAARAATWNCPDDKLGARQ